MIPLRSPSLTLIKAFRPSVPSLSHRQFRSISGWNEFVMASTGPEEKLKKKGSKRRFADDGNNGSRGGWNGSGKGGSHRFNPNKQQKKPRPASEGSKEEVLMHEIEALLAEQKLEDESKPLPEDEATNGGTAETVATEILPEPGSEIEVECVKLSSTGDGLARQPGLKQIYVVPFALPGDIVKVKVYRHLKKEKHTVADYISVVKPGPLRDDSRVACKYFTKCSGCQFQQMSYADQLAHKRSIVENAFKHFSQLPPELVPTILETIGSPLQYGYRTKLTPHFDSPPGTSLKRKADKPKLFWETAPPVGFNEKATRKVLDIEDCPIGTEAVRKGLARERARIKEDYAKFSNGATILLRESTIRTPKDGNSEVSAEQKKEIPSDVVIVETEKYTDIKSCVTDNNAESTEYIDDFVFTNAAGSFFQNNNSILPPFTDYIRQHILPPSSSTSSSSPDAAPAPSKPIKYLIDAYSGSGLFTITQSALFSGGSIGIDIDEKSINWARRNATLNKLHESQCKFIAADAQKLFQSVAGFDPDETVVVLDPPRKGCDGSFLRQLLKFAPRRIVYVSCNVHTQARDVGNLVRGEVSGMGDEDPFADWSTPSALVGKKAARYEIESIRGFDFFPQTGHVEGVAVLNRVNDV